MNISSSGRGGSEKGKETSALGLRVTVRYTNIVAAKVRAKPAVTLLAAAALVARGVLRTSPCVVLRQYLARKAEGQQTQ